MPSWKSRLNDQQIWELVAYVLVSQRTHPQRRAPLARGSHDGQARPCSDAGGGTSPIRPASPVSAALSRALDLWPRIASGPRRNGIVVVMFGTGSVIWLAVATLAIVAACMHWSSRTAAGASDRRLRRVITLGGVVITVGILAAFLVYDFSVGLLLAQRAPPDLTISLVGHQMVVGSRIRRLRAIQANQHRERDSRPDWGSGPAQSYGRRRHSQLLGPQPQREARPHSRLCQHDLVPGGHSKACIRGQCAEFCGLQHATMALYIVAETPREVCCPGGPRNPHYRRHRVTPPPVTARTSSWRRVARPATTSAGQRRVRPSGQT